MINYLCSTNKYILVLTTGSETVLGALKYVKWGGYLSSTQRSRTEIIIYYNCAPIFFTCQSQKDVSLRSSEAENMAVPDATVHVQKLWQVLENIEYHQPSTFIHHGNDETREWAGRGAVAHFFRHKHIDIRHQSVTDAIKQEKLIP